MDDRHPPGPEPSPRPPVLAVVLGDFGRDAGLRFVAALSRLERRRLRREHPGDPGFYDEQRRITLAVVGDLPFVKRPWLEDFERGTQPLDDRILVGFPGGVPLEEVTPRLGALALEAMSGAVQRSATRTWSPAWLPLVWPPGPTA